ncbi:MAG: hypothetical protein ACRD37_09455 [Candidatus Acidiferrales bacterium]
MAALLILPMMEYIPQNIGNQINIIIETEQDVISVFEMHSGAARISALRGVQAVQTRDYGANPTRRSSAWKRGSLRSGS